MRPVRHRTRHRTRHRAALRVVGGLAAVTAPVLALGACGDDGDGTADTTAALAGPAAEGQELFRSEGCGSCHSVDGAEGVGPGLAGLAGSEVTLEDGVTVTADAAYLRRSVVDPTAQVVDGFNPIMPERRLSEADVTALVAYLEAIGRGAAGS